MDLRWLFSWRGLFLVAAAIAIVHFFVPIAFIYTVAGLVALQFLVVMLFKQAIGRNAITLAVSKPMVLWTVGTIATIWIILFKLPFAQTPVEFITPIATFFFLPLFLIRAIYWGIEEIREAQIFDDNFRREQGGSARWAGEAAFRQAEMPSGWGAISAIKNPAPWIFLGRSRRRFDSSPRNVGVLTDIHMLTLGMTGAGKSRLVLNNNLSIWPGSMLVLDPKGELARDTLTARAHFHPRIRILDPFNARDLEGKHDAFKCGFNPLTEFDIHSEEASSYVTAIADGCFVADSGQNKFWKENGEFILAGAIAQVLSDEPPENHNMPFVADTLTMGGNEGLAHLLAKMSTNYAIGGLPAKAAAIIQRAGEKERGILLNELQRSLRWVSDPQMRASLLRNDFSLRELADGQGSSVYIVLPFEKMKDTAQNRWMRVLIRLGLLAVQEAEEKPDPPVLFVLDEFPALGHFESVKNHFRELRGAGIKLWLLAQDGGALKDIYGESWEGFSGNAVTQIIATKCRITCKWVSDSLGQFMQRQPNGTLMSRPLLEPAEVRAYLGKEAGNQIVLTEQGADWQITSVNWGTSPHGYRKP